MFFHFGGYLWRKYLLRLVFCGFRSEGSYLSGTETYVRTVPGKFPNLSSWSLPAQIPSTEIPSVNRAYLNAYSQEDVVTLWHRRENHESNPLVDNYSSRILGQLYTLLDSWWYQGFTNLFNSYLVHICFYLNLMVYLTKKMRSE